MYPRSFIKLYTVLACIKLTAGIPFPNLFRRSGRPRTRLFGNRFPTGGYTTTQKKPATRPFTIPGFEEALGQPNRRRENRALDFGLGGRALIDPIAGLYDPPLSNGGGGGSGGDLSFINGAGDFGIVRQGGLMTSGFDVGGSVFNIPTRLQDQFGRSGNLGSQNLGFIDQGSSGVFSAANTRDVGSLDMGGGLRQPLDVRDFGNQMSLGQSDLSFNGGNQLNNGISLQNQGFGQSLNNGNQMPLGPSGLSFNGGGQLSNGIGLQNQGFGPGLTDQSQLGLGSSNLGLGGNQIGGLGTGSQLGLDRHQLGLGSNQLQMNQNQLGLDTNQIGLGGNQLDLGSSQNFLLGNGMDLTSGKNGLLSSQLSVGSNQLDFGNGGLGGGGTSQMSLGDNSFIDGQLGVGMSQLGIQGTLQDQVGGVLPTQISLSNSQFLSPAEDPLAQQVNPSASPLGGLTGTTSGQQLQLGQTSNLGSSLTSQFDATGASGQLDPSLMTTSQLNQPLTGQSSGSLNSQFTNSQLGG